MKLKIVRKSGKWLAVRAMAAYAAGGGQAMAQAQTPAPSTRSSVRFSIAAGPLADALAEFERTAGWKIEIPDARMATLSTKGVSGALSADEALRELLSGTGLKFTMTAPVGARLSFDTVRGSVDVSDRAPVSNPRYTEPLRNLPKTITIIPKEIIDQQGATSLAEVMRNVPGMTMTAGEGGGAAGDNLTHLGNSVRNDIFVDGVRDLSPQSRDPFNLESVEITKGPTSAITGRGSAGGAINLVSMGPGINRFLSGTVALASASTKRASFDVNTSLRKLGFGERSAFRMNAMLHDADSAGRDVVTNNRWGLGSFARLRSRNAYALYPGLLQAEAGQHSGLRYPLGSGDQ